MEALSKQILPNIEVRMGEDELEDLRHRIRHSAAHVMADVVTDMYPDTKLAIGPPTEDGTYVPVHTFHLRERFPHSNS